MRRRHLVALLAVMGIAIVATLAFALTRDDEGNPHAAVDGPDVTMFRNDPARTGVLPGPGPAGEPTVLWRIDLAGGCICSPPSVVDGVVYASGFAADNTGLLLAVEAATGVERWRFTAGAEISGSPAVDGGAEGTIYIGSADDVVHALEAESGEERWRFATGTEVRTSPVLANGSIYLGRVCKAVTVGQP